MTFEFPRSRIQIFCKVPVPGQVMTRLIDELGAEGAAKLHRRLATRIIDECRRAGLAPVELWCTPATDHEFFTAMTDETVSLHLQQGEDLGERMFEGARFALEDESAASVVIIGTDCPELDAAYLRLALQRLDDHDAVIGPARDGGYGLIGFQAVNRRYFSDIAWGGDTVCADTCRAFNDAGLNWSLLPLLHDIDTPEDLKTGLSKRTLNLF
ncbi:MAG: TIGR04282 family arsenosugar biosynthesis glycosyltransferase [Pseudomonadales bacterium]|nr:TIGR04282 family arsenosugar biosynthesis glycosyltransferase [Pseudomonadales bacterium]